MKKLILTAVLIICGIIPLITSCGNDTNNETVSPPEEHVHNFSETYNYDNIKHWNKCSCGEETNIEMHNYSSNGSCKCGYSLKVSEGLNYTLVGYECEVSGIGKCKDSNIFIPSRYNGLFVVSIGDRAFERCSSLTSIVILSCLRIGDWAFSSCHSLTSVTIGSNLTSIGNAAFGFCNSLTSITFAEGSNLTSIGENAFARCSSLTSIKIPNSVTSIGNGAFSGCSSLTSIEIPNGVTRIKDSAFSDCSSLTSIVIPNSVTIIESFAFARCSSLANVYYEGSIEEWNSIIDVSDHTYLTNANRYYYSETKPTDTTNKYWHYVDGVITIW